MGGGGDDFDPIGTPMHWVDEGIGEITGRNRKRGEANDARKVAAAAQERENARNLQLMELQQNDINASNAAAAAATKTPRVPGSIRTSAGPSQPLGSSRNLLGR